MADIPEEALQDADVQTRNISFRVTTLSAVSESLGVLLSPKTIVAQKLLAPISNLSLVALSPSQLYLSAAGYRPESMQNGAGIWREVSSIRAEIFPLTSALADYLTDNASKADDVTHGYDRMGVSEVQHLAIAYDRVEPISEIQVLSIAHAGIRSGTFMVYLDTYASESISVDISADALKRAIQGVGGDHGAICVNVEKMVNSTENTVKYRINFVRPYGDIPLLKIGNVISAHSHELSFKVTRYQQGLPAPTGLFRIFDTLSNTYSDFIPVEPCPTSSSIENAMSAITALGRVRVTKSKASDTYSPLCASWNITFVSKARNLNLLQLDLSYAKGVSGNISTVSEGVIFTETTTAELSSTPYGDIQRVTFSSLDSLVEIQNITLIPGPSIEVIQELN